MSDLAAADLTAADVGDRISQPRLPGGSGGKPIYHMRQFVNGDRMIQMLRLVLAGCVVSLVLSPDTAWCQFRFPCGDKQQCYDDDWTEHRSGQYWYVRYYFKADPKADAFGYHYVIFFPNRENLYYYNPQKKTYWCRALINQPRGVDGRPRKNKIWNVLPAQGNVRKQRLEDIPESEWEKNQSVPNIPGTGKDGPLMEFPPQPPNVS